MQKFENVMVLHHEKMVESTENIIDLETGGLVTIPKYRKHIKLTVSEKLPSLNKDGIEILTNTIFVFEDQLAKAAYAKHCNRLAAKIAELDIIEANLANAASAKLAAGDIAGYEKILKSTIVSDRRQALSSLTCDYNYIGFRIDIVVHLIKAGEMLNPDAATPTVATKDLYVYHIANIQ